VAVAKILVADGDLTSQVAMGKALAADGHVTRTAFTGEEAVQRFSADTFELLITELSLPKIDGVALIGRLRERGLLERVPFILVASTNEREAYRIAHELGALDVITKPIEPVTVQTRVRRAIDRFRSGQTGLHADAVKRFGFGAGGAATAAPTAAVIRPTPSQGQPVVTLPPLGTGTGRAPAPPAPPPDATPMHGEYYGTGQDEDAGAGAGGDSTPPTAGGAYYAPAPDGPYAGHEEAPGGAYAGEAAPGAYGHEQAHEAPQAPAGSTSGALGLPGEFGLPGDLGPASQEAPAADSGAIRAAEIANAFGIGPKDGDPGASGGFDPFFSPAAPGAAPARAPLPPSPGAYPFPAHGQGFGQGQRESPALVSPSQYSTPPLLAGPAGAEATRRRLRGDQPVYEMPPASAQRPPQPPPQAPGQPAYAPGQSSSFLAPASPQGYVPGQTSSFTPFVPQPPQPQAYTPGQSSAFMAPQAPQGYQPGHTGTFAPLGQPGHTGTFAPLGQPAYQPGHTGSFAPLSPPFLQGQPSAQPQPHVGETSGGMLSLDTSGRRVKLPTAPGQAFVPPSIARPDCEGALGPIQLAELVRLMFLGRKSGFLDAAYNEYRAEIAFVMGEIIRVGIYVGGREVNRSLVALKTACGWKQGRYRIVFAEIQQTAALVKSTAAFLAEIFGKAGTSEDYLGPSSKTGPGTAGPGMAGPGPGTGTAAGAKPMTQKPAPVQKQPLPGKFPPPGQMR